MTPDEIGRVLGRVPSRTEIGSIYHPDAVWFGSDPLGRRSGRDEIADVFASIDASWDSVVMRPLGSFEVVLDVGCALVVVGAWRCRLVSPWMGMPATGSLHEFRSLEVHRIVEGAIAESTVMLDLLDLATQCGRFDTGPAAHGSMWPGPRSVGDDDSDAAAAVAVWLAEVADPAEDLEALLRARHLARLSPTYRWHGPAAIGSFEGGRAFVAGQQYPFRRSFSARRSGAGSESHRHVVHGAAGGLVASGGWPAIVARHSGSDWLGIPASGAEVALRIVDVYAVARGQISENWVMIDMVHALTQMGIETGFDPAP